MSARAASTSSSGHAEVLVRVTLCSRVRILVCMRASASACNSEERSLQHTNLIIERYVSAQDIFGDACVEGETNKKSNADRRFPRVFTGSDDTTRQKAVRRWKPSQRKIARRYLDIRTGLVTENMED